MIRKITLLYLLVIQGHSLCLTNPVDTTKLILPNINSTTSSIRFNLSSPFSDDWPSVLHNDIGRTKVECSYDDCVTPEMSLAIMHSPIPASQRGAKFFNLNQFMLDFGDDYIYERWDDFVPDGWSHRSHDVVVKVRIEDIFFSCQLFVVLRRLLHLEMQFGVADLLVDITYDGFLAAILELEFF